MQREIKFRVYDKDRLKMYYLLENRRSFGTSEFDRAVDWEDVFADKHEELVIMQYTGLKDKNGKEIYEGDIVRQVSYKYSNDEYGHKGFYENISKVLYKGRAFQYEWIKTNEIEMPKDFKESFIEVIGNIYDNPELLEKGEE